MSKPKWGQRPEEEVVAPVYEMRGEPFQQGQMERVHGYEWDDFPEEVRAVAWRRAHATAVTKESGEWIKFVVPSEHLKITLPITAVWGVLRAASLPKAVLFGPRLYWPRHPRSLDIRKKPERKEWKPRNGFKRRPWSKPRKPKRVR